MSLFLNWHKRNACEEKILKGFWCWRGMHEIFGMVGWLRGEEGRGGERRCMKPEGSSFSDMSAGSKLKRPVLYQYAGVYTPVLQSGHQFCIGNGCWGSAATSAVKHLGWARHPLSPPCNHGLRGGGFCLFLCNGGEESAGSTIMSASDSSATGLICNKVRCWCSPFCLITLHANSASSSMSTPVCLLWDIFFFLFFSAPLPSHSCLTRSLFWFTHFASISPLLLSPLPPPAHRLRTCCAHAVSLPQLWMGYFSALCWTCRHICWMSLIWTLSFCVTSGLFMKSYF